MPSSCATFTIFRNGAYILLSFPVQFHICDVPAAGDGVERRFAPDLLGDADRLFTSTWKELT